MAKHSNDAIVPASVAKGPTTRALLLRDGSQEPIDDLEYDYLVHLAHDFELIYEANLKSARSAISLRPSRLA